jgi:FMN phosphatase YigB (HAD superfamily)
MKYLFENWREYLKEENKQVVTFDFDDTLSKSDFNDDTGTWKHTGPHEPMIKRIKEFINEPNTSVYVITSRYEDREDKSLKNEDQRSVREFLDDHNLRVDGVFFTNGQPKIETLLKLGSSMHHDDDPEDILDAQQAGIMTIPSDPYGIFSKLLKAYEKERNEKIESIL